MFVYKEQVTQAISSDMRASAKRAEKLIKDETIEKNRAKNTSVSEDVKLNISDYFCMGKTNRYIHMLR